MGYVLIGLASAIAASLGGDGIVHRAHRCLDADVHPRHYHRPDVPDGRVRGTMTAHTPGTYRTWAAWRRACRCLADSGGLPDRRIRLSLGLPGTSGFAFPRSLVFLGTFNGLELADGARGHSGWCITAGYILWMIQRAMFGPRMRAMVRRRSRRRDPHRRLIPIAVLVDRADHPVRGHISGVHIRRVRNRHRAVSCRIVTGAQVGMR